MRLATLALALLFGPAVAAQPISTWTLQTSGTAEDLADVHALSATTVFAVADGGLLLRTDDGGTTWTQTVLLGGALDLQGIAFNPAGTVGLIVTDGGGVLRTTDGGATWTPIATGMTDGRAAISWADDSAVWVAGRESSAAVSTDAGASWTSRPSGSADRTESIAAVSATTAWVANRSGGLRQTTDGATWSPQASGTTEDLKDIQMADAQTGYVAASGNTVLKTTNGGATWANVATAGVSGNGLHVADAETVWVVADAGQIWFTATGGAVWELQPTPTTQAFNRVHFATPSLGWAVGDAGTIVRFDAGPIATDGAPAEAALSLAVGPTPASRAATVWAETARAETVTVLVVDVLGREVARLHHGALGAGRHVFGLATDGLAPGRYLVRASTASGSALHPLTVVR